MKVVALVSGGKDSCYAMMRCVDYGHEIVALANLMPMDDAVDELDSYMYQTVGHQILASYAECMGLPLFRRRIQGSTRHKHLGYKMTSGDEVEDMFLLLKEVKEKIPCITAVSSGAIASDYQRLRVENVCSRLSLVSLSYLWQQDQTLLLEEMIRREVTAITIKVAAMGLIPAKHLGKHIMDLHGPLHQLKELYGINVCGEGGEYETLTLDCPLFRNARIVLNDYKIIMHSMDSIAPVGIIHPLSFHLESKVGFSHIDTSGFSHIDTSDGHETTQRKAGPVFEVLGDSIPTQLANCSYEENTLRSCASKMKALHVTTRKHTFLISCWNPCDSSNGLEDDLTATLRKVESQLGAYGFGWANVIYIHLYISDMDNFALANEVYLRFITENRCPMGVPSRSCIELPLVQAGFGNSYIEVLVADDDTKNVLHVQSISCWAPSCIGPYSQATLHKEILYMAGQLGLDPPTMKLCSGGPAAEFQQALNNCVAVIRSFNSSISSGILFVIYCSASLTSADRLDVQCIMEKFLSEGASKNQNEKPSNIPDPIFIYVLSPALPKRAYVEVKPVLYVPESRQASTPIYVPDGQGCIGMLPTWDLEPLSLTDSCIQKFIISGRICASAVFITSDVAAELCSISNQGTPDYSCYKFEKNIKRISRFCVYHLHRTLLENNFSWSELTSLRIYFAMSHIARESLRNAFRETFVELSDITNGIPRADEETIFSLVPVLSAGGNSNMGDLITCELFASKL